MSLKSISKCIALTQIMILPDKPSERTLNTMSKGEVVWTEIMAHEIGGSAALRNCSTIPFVDQ